MLPGRTLIVLTVLMLTECQVAAQCLFASCLARALFAGKARGEAVISVGQTFLSEPAQTRSRPHRLRKMRWYRPLRLLAFLRIPP